jgi:hypothetical protein
VRTALHFLCSYRTHIISSGPVKFALGEDLAVEALLDHVRRPAQVRQMTKIG